MIFYKFQFPFDTINENYFNSLALIFTNGQITREEGVHF